MAKMNRKRMFGIIAVIGLLVFLYWIGALKPIDKVIATFLNPLFTGVYRASTEIRSSYNNQSTAEELKTKIQELEKENQRLVFETERLKAVEEENKELRQSLNFFTEKRYNYILGNVISRGNIMDVGRQTETLIINKGSNDGIVSGLAVVNGEGIIVGKVIDVKDGISEVCLTNNEKCQFAVAIINEEKTSGIIEGELGLTVRMKFIPQDKQVEEGDIVVTSGLERNIPRGLAIGRIVEVNRESNELWQNAIVEPLVDNDELIIVSVLLP